MSVYQIYLSDEQKKSLLNYIEDRRSKHMALMYVSLILTIIVLPLIIVDIKMRGRIDDINEELITLLFPCAVSFLTEFVTGIGKRFGYGSDKWYLNKDDYEMECMKFGSRQEDKGNHPYYINDTRGVSYICPKFLDYKNADSDTDFLYITLKNGSKYAISAK